MERHLEDILGGPRPSFDELLEEKRQLREAEGQGLTAEDIFSAKRESAQEDVLGFTSDQLYNTGQFNPDEVPGFDPEVTDELESIGQGHLAVPTFPTAGDPIYDRPRNIARIGDIDQLELQQHLVDLSGGDVDFLRYLAEQVGSESFGQEFIERSQEGFWEEMELADERARFLHPAGEGGGFTVEQSMAFQAENRQRAREREWDFGDFVTSKIGDIWGSFQTTPTHIAREEQRLAKIESDRLQEEKDQEREIQELEFERRRTLRSRPRKAFR